MNEEKIKNLVDSYDAYANRIDNGPDYRRALRNNQNILDILAYFGLNLKLENIKPIKKAEYEIMGYTCKTLEDAKDRLNEHTKYLQKRVNDKHDDFTKENMDEILSRINVTKIEYIPIETSYSYTLKEKKLNLKDSK